MKTYRNIILLIAFLVFWAEPSPAKDMFGVKFAPAFKDYGQEMVLRGVGFKRVFFMRAFVAGFYLEENKSSDQASENIPKRIEVSYFVNVPGEKLSKYTEDLIQKNLSKKEFKSIESKIVLMRQYFVDLHPGDRYALTYIPDIGTNFEYNGKVVGTIEGADFAKGIFSTWIGEKPMDERIKNQILGVTSISDEELKMAFNE